MPPFGGGTSTTAASTAAHGAVAAAAYYRGGKTSAAAAAVAVRRAFAAAASSGGGGGSSSRGRPPFRVPAHVASFTVLLLPALAFWAYYETGGKHDRERHLEEELRGRYKSEIAVASNKNKAMAEFFQKMQSSARQSDDGGGNVEFEAKVDELLKGGKAGKNVKRIASVDPKLYGTAEGAALQREDVAAIIAKGQRQQSKKKKRKKKKKDEDAAAAAEEGKVGGDETKTTAKAAASSSNSTSQIWTVVGVATVAAVAGFLAGNNRRQ